MVDELHRRNRTMKHLMSGVWRGWGRQWADLTNVQYKPIWNCHSESPLYNEYNLIKDK
jgi:hypothetical protein